MNDLIRKEQQLDHSLSDVWNAISKGDEISLWFIKADFKAEVGYDYTFTHENTVIKGRVLEVEPMRKLSYTWMVEGTGVETTVIWNLSENADGTHLVLEHSGISNYPGEMATTMLTNFDNGWMACISQLIEYLTKEHV